MKIQKCIFEEFHIILSKMSQEFDIYRDCWDYYDDASRRKTFFYENAPPPSPEPQYTTQQSIHTDSTDEFLEAVDRVLAQEEDRYPVQRTLPASDNTGKVESKNQLDLSTPENVYKYMADKNK
jgi:hypothetical protein